MSEASGSNSPRGILRSTAVVGLCTGISRLLGFAREVWMFNYFGTTLARSAFDVAFRIPNLFRRLFGEGALSGALVPVLTEIHEREGIEAGNRLIGKVLTMLATALIAIVIGGVLLITAVMMHADLDPRTAAVLPLLRMMLPYMIFICLVAACMAILNSLHHFAVPAATPIVLNVVWILTLILLCPHMGQTASDSIVGVAYGILIAGALQLMIQLPVLAHYGIRPRVSFSWRDPQVRRVLALMGPAAVGMGAHQINVCLDGILALWAAKWGPAALTAAERLIYLPLGLIATAMGTVLLPAFSRQAALERPRDMLPTLATAVRNVMLITIPAAVGLGVLARPIIQLAFESGKFDADSTSQATRALWFYAPGLIVFSLYKLLVPIFYALKDVRTPLRVALKVVLLNLVLNVVFVITWPADYKHAGLALATVIASTVNCLVLALVLRKRLGTPGWMRLGGSALRALAASGVMVVAAKVVLHWVRELPMLSAQPPKLVQAVSVGAAIAVALVVYTSAAALLCRGECRQLMTALRRRR